MSLFVRIRRLQECFRFSIPEPRFWKWKMLLIFVSLMLVVSGMTTAQASVSGSTSYSASLPSLPGAVIPEGTILSISISASISGTATITDPHGNTIAAMGMSGGTVILDETGTYNISESYRMVASAEFGPFSDEVEDEASSERSFDNLIPGGIGTFEVSSDVSLSAGDSSGNVSVSVDGMTVIVTATEDIDLGVSSAWASIDINWSVNTSMSVEVPPDTGTIVVSTNLDQASFSLSGPESYSGSGKSWTTTGALVGDYTITYNDVPGYETPPSDSQTLTKDGTIGFSGIYNFARQVGIIEVSTNLGNATFSLSGPTNYTQADFSVHDSGTHTLWTLTGVDVGDYTITYNDVPGYVTPASETQTLAADGTIMFTGIYEIPQVGAIEVITNLKNVTFSLSGTASYTQADFTVHDSETQRLWVLTGVDAGEYRIVYGDVPGYRTPPPETKTLTPGGKLDFTGQYIILTGVIEVITNLRNATFRLSGAADYTEADFTVHDLETQRLWILVGAPVGEYNIVYGDIPDYKTPPQETKILTPDGTVSFTGEYMPLPPVIHSVEVSGSPAKAGATISVSMSGDAGGTATFSIVSIVDDVSMTESASTPGSYTGEYVVREGENAVDAVVSVKLIGILGAAATNEDEAVTIDTTPPAIESVEISGSPAKNVGDVVTVVMLGEPGGVAVLSITDIMQDIPMPESDVSPGTYRGYYTAAEGMNVREAKVVVRLTDAVGNVSMDESKTVSISTAPWDVNGDGVVDLSDIEAVSSNMGKTPTPELDVNGDGVIDILDLALIGIHFGEEYSGDGRALAPAKPLSQEALAPFVTSYSLVQNYPNPCNPDTWIPFTLAEAGEVVVTIYNSMGQLIRRLDLGYRNPGVYVNKDRAAYWDGSNEFGEEAASGMYFYHIQSGDFSATRKMLISR